MLHAQDLSFRYGPIQALHSVSFEASPGEFVGILGPNGSGKSTLLKILSGIVSPESGEVRLNGRALGEYKKRPLSRLAAYLPQTLHYDFPFTVRDFVRMGRAPYFSFFGGGNGEDVAMVEMALEKTGCLSLAGRLVTTLSGGERQRALLAQALAQGTSLLILDEPVTHLDIGHQLQILRVLREEARNGKIVIASFHELNLASHFSTRLFLLSAGRGTASGAPAEVLTPRLLREVFGIAARIVSSPESGKPVLIFEDEQKTEQPAHE